MSQHSEMQDLWTTLKGDFKTLFPSDIYETWFEPIRGVEENDNSLTLSAPNEFAKIWIQDNGIKFSKKDILSSPRIGVDYAKEDAKLPYRFYIKDNKWISKL